MTGKCACEGCSYQETQAIAMLSHVFEQDTCVVCGGKLTRLTAQNFATLRNDGIITVVNRFGFSGSRLTSMNTAALSTAMLVFTATSDMTVIFDWRVSSEPNFDLFKVDTTADGNLVIASGEKNGSVEVLLRAGEKLTVKYLKDGSGSSGSDCAFLSNVQLVY
jgi:hypothetical protein